MVSYYLMFWVVRSFLVFSGFGLCSQVLGLSILPLNFSFILPVVSRLLPLYSTDNKMSRLMVKRFSPVRDTQRGSELHEKEEREDRDRDEQEETKARLKRREADLQFSVSSVFSIAQTPTEIHRIGLGREGERRK